MNISNVKESKFLSLVLIIVSSIIWPVVVQASNAQSLPLQGKGIRTAVHDETGYLSFIGADPNAPINVAGAQAPGLSASGQAMEMMNAYGAQFGLENPNQELRVIGGGSYVKGRSVVKYQQTYKGIGVLGGELMLNMTDQGQMVSISGEISPELQISTQPKITAGKARSNALAAVSKTYGISTYQLRTGGAELWIFDERLLIPSSRPAELVWCVEVSAMNGAPIKELVLVNAEYGGISFHFNQVDWTWHADAPVMGGGQKQIQSPSSNLFDVFQSSAGLNGNLGLTFGDLFGVNPVGGVPLYETYTANNTESPLPGTLLCTQALPDCTSGSDLHADAAHRHARDAYDYFYNTHNRDSIDDAGMTIVSTVHYGSGINNAYWDGGQMIYGDAAGYPLADDVAGHELTHGVTENTSNLFYYYQSGAINESLSDVWGEFIDLTNGAGNDDPGVRWLMGEDITGLGAIRDMSNPPAFGDPDKITSPNYHLGDMENLYIVPYDNGGVHFNSGVNNKAVYLMVEGGSFNGYNISALDSVLETSITKVAAIYYEVETNMLTSGSDYKDLYYAVYQACLNLVGGAEGITSGDCVEVQKALDAVEMDHQPVALFNPDAEVCPEGLWPNDLFFDDFESGDGNWTFESSPGAADWGLVVGYAASGAVSLWGQDSDSRTEIKASMTDEVALPSSSDAYLHFMHAYGFDQFYYEAAVYYFDGGVLEFEVNGVWYPPKNTPILFDSGRSYNGSIYAGAQNALAGKNAFVGDSHGYVSSKYNLSMLRGQNVRFRWRIGTDISVGGLGWLLDDVRIYTCETGPPPPPTCNPLTLTHTGNGTTPTASPTNSIGCAAGEYYRDEVITLSGAAPDPGWVISGWTGTDNDASNAATNTVTMPDNVHEAGVDYVQPPGVGTYDDRYPGINYSGGWGQINMGGPYAGTLTNSNTVGNSGSFTFDGAEITLVYLAYSNGTIEVSIDGGPVDIIDTSSSSPMWQQEWSSGPLAAGIHTIAFTHASGANVYVDAFIVTGPPPPPTCNPLTLTHTGNGTTPTASPTNSIGCAAGEYYRDEVITLSGAAADPSWVISGWTGTDNDASTTATNTVTMPDSIHTAGVNYVQPPGVGTYDDRYAGIGYSGSWQQASLNGPYAGTLTYSNTIGNSGSFTFDGEGITLVYLAFSNGTIEVSIDGGPVDIIDTSSSSPMWQQEWSSGPLAAGVHTIAFTHASGANVYVDAFKVTGPPPPPPCYLLTVTHTGNGTTPTASPSNSTGCPVGEYHSGEVISLSGAAADPDWVIAWWTGTDNDISTEATNTVTMPDSIHTAGVNYVQPPTAGTYDDRFPGVFYSGSWQQGPLGNTHDGTLTYSKTIDNSGSFTFDGVGITLVFFAYIDGGTMEVSIDGVPVDTIDMFGSSPMWRQEWYSGALSPGVHTISFKHTTGTTVYIDAFIVEGP